MGVGAGALALVAAGQVAGVLAGFALGSGRRSPGRSSPLSMARLITVMSSLSLYGSAVSRSNSLQSRSGSLSSSGGGQ